MYCDVKHKGSMETNKNISNGHKMEIETWLWGYFIAVNLMNCLLVSQTQLLTQYVLEAH